jgi:hypothetical protein
MTWRGTASMKAALALSGPESHSEPALSGLTAAAQVATAILNIFVCRSRRSLLRFLLSAGYALDSTRHFPFSCPGARQPVGTGRSHRAYECRSRRSRPLHPRERRSPDEYPLCVDVGVAGRRASARRGLKMPPQQAQDCRQLARRRRRHSRFLLALAVGSSAFSTVFLRLPRHRFVE